MNEMQGLPLPHEKQVELILHVATMIAQGKWQMTAAMFHADGIISMEIESNAQDTQGRPR